MALAVALSVFLVVAIVEAATTISTNIVTGGTLQVDTTSTLTGDVTAGADLIVTSGARVGTGSDGTHLTALAGDSFFVEGQGEFDGIVWFDASLRASSTALITGALTTYGNVTLGDAAGDVIVLTGNSSTTNSLTVGTNLYVDASASTTDLRVGGLDSANGLLAGMIHGTCNIAQESVTASTTKGVRCTTATGVTTSFKTFIQGASSTANGVIGVQLVNLTGADATPAGTLNFWAVR